MSIFITLPDRESDDEVDFPLTQPPRQSTPETDRGASGGASATRPSSLRRDPMRTGRFQDNERDMWERHGEFDFEETLINLGDPISSCRCLVGRRTGRNLSPTLSFVRK
jgi:hypothetical protein